MRKKYIIVFPAILSLSAAYAQNTAVNSSPTLHAVADLTLKPNGDTRYITLTGITAGDELQQLTSLSVSSSNNGLIEMLEADQTSNGQAFIRYRLKPGSSGSATISVRVTDNGTPAAEINRSFNLTVEPAAGYSPPPVKNTPAAIFAVPDKKIMLKAYPNPFPSSATISFSTPADEQRTNLDIYHLSGAKIKQLYSASTTAGQTYSVPVNNTGLPPGMYILRLTTSHQTEQLKLILAQ